MNKFINIFTVFAIFTLVISFLGCIVAYDPMSCVFASLVAILSSVLCFISVTDIVNV